MRSFLRHVVFDVSLAAAVMTIGCTEEESPAASGNSRARQEHRWEYSGEDGPERWGELSSDYAACRGGVEQSPLDLAGAKETDLKNIAFDYGKTQGFVVNTGHTIEVNVDPGNTITVDGAVYTLRQFHFHTPSEHAIDGVFAPLEVHFVHLSDDREVAVVGGHIEVGTKNIELKPVFDDLPGDEDAEIPLKEEIDLGSLLPSDRRFYSYMGSLTTPPCTEGVKWHVLSGKLQVSEEQLEAFTAIYPLNARPLQELGARKILLDVSP
jgi:carbonic anhydrase